MSAVRQAVEREHIESHPAGPPGRKRAQQETRGANDLALLGGRDRGERAAKVAPRALTHLDHGQDDTVAADDIDLAALAANVARKQLDALGREILGSQRFSRGAVRAPQCGGR